MNQNKITYFLGVILFSLCAISVAYTVALVQSQFRRVFESKKTDIRQIPEGLTRNQAGIDRTFRVPILLYHYVEYVKDKGDTIRQSLNVEPHAFEKQIKTLKDAGYTFLTASQLADIMDGIIKMPPKPILITFDDGHWDVFTDILPILTKYRAKATVYMVSSWIGYNDFMTKEQLEAVIQSGLIEIGSHTMHHVALSDKFLPIVQLEVVKSKSDLESLFHMSIVSFAYPGGYFDQQSIDVVKNAGFRTAMSTIPGIEQRISQKYFLYRIRPGYRTGNELIRYLEQSSFTPW